MADGRTLPPLRDVIAQHRLAADKSLGQHFLLDLNLCARIARTAGDVTIGTTIEIGPGPGGLTRALLEAGAQVIAIEKDSRCQPILAELAEAFPGRLTVVAGDAMAVNCATLGTAPRRIVANLPYNVATELLLQWLTDIGSFESLTLMFQQEVAERLAAEPGTKTYGRLSIMTQWLCQVALAFDVNPRAFTPPPKVNSTVVSLRPRPQPLAAADRKTLERVTAAAFGQRRKMLRQSLKVLATSIGLADGTALCSAADIDPTARAETLTVEQFCALANIVDTNAAALARRTAEISPRPAGR
ncbi:MAG: 16S rRNA (adenine(1518)-N(6)/adenine(1519)-N(6))-dimethyltransferase RsmA [Rhodospirillaceae bacterium]|nr:MAG: 16S rRNA (adenine(1518)-N(6)/adenine(1519)-N(6))-dimethyltransferase RsmA [Rhodospirillaceae bacterium]